MKNIFVSGGAGFIGSHLAARLLSDPLIAQLVVYDNFSSGPRNYLDAHRGDARLKIVEADLKDLETLKAAMAGSDTVFHLAANPDIAKAVTQPDIDFWQGTFLAQHVLEAMRVNRVQRIFYTSGSGVYGENANTEFKENYGPCLPISTYGASKLACEALICSYCHMFGIVGRAFRFANVVGPKQTHGVGFDFIRRLKADPTCLRILGDGSQSKSYIHVEDILNAVFLAGERAQGPYDIFNVATGDYLTVKAIADLAVKVSGLDARSVRYDFTGGDRGWKGDVPIVRFNTEKIQGLGWRCQRSSSEAIYDSMAAMKTELNLAQS
jgi:UDP-glucose 4-epimerase